ncbi:MAG: CapA family protein, partial [Clostridia bacterium]|nr:CapA family protein [Clostridia bacterium]
WLLIRNAPAGEKKGQEPDETVTAETLPVTEETALSKAYVVKVAHDAENLMKRLATTGDQKADAALKDLTERLERSAEYLRDTEEDYYGATYFGKAAEILRDVQENPFLDTASFSSRVSMILTELANTYPQESAKEGLYYPVFDTDPNGTTARAMLALFRQQYARNTGSILLTFGGNALFGDTLLGAERTDGFKAREAASELNYPLYDLSSVLQNDTATFINLENPLTSSTEASKVSGSFKGLPSYAELLKKSGVEIVSLANNGVMDYGTNGYNDTTKALKDGGVEYTENGVILYHATDIGTVAYISYNIIDQKGKDVNLTSAPNTDISHARENGAKIVVIHFNWVNTEKNAWDPSMSQVKTVRNAVDQGADLVIATHPDSMEAIEKYKGVYIVYSPGNLTKNGTPAASGFLFQQAFSVGGDGGLVRGVVNVFPISTSHGTDGVPFLMLDGGSATAFLSTIKQYSSTVKYGVAKKNDFPITDLNVISITK